MIEPSREWQEVIELALRSCDIMLAYVTPDFRESRWCDQEVGWALGRELVVLPVKVEADPYGFFGTYQALPVSRGEQPRNTAMAVSRSLVLAIFGMQRPGAVTLIPRMANTVVEAFYASRTFETTIRRFELLRLVPKSAWTADHVTRIKMALSENSKVRDCVLPLDPPTAVSRAVAELLSRMDRRFD